MLENSSFEDALLVFRQKLTSALIEEAKKKGYSLSHFEALKFIGQSGNSTMKDIANRLNITPPSASSLIDTLVAKELVSRVEVPGDRRSINIVLTPKANVLLSSIYGQKDSIFREMFSKLSSEDKETLAHILIKCIK
jgi:DNA-binding MarR family transcriptional regulator